MNHRCIDCNNKCHRCAMRCRRCQDIRRKQLIKGKNNPNFKDGRTLKKNCCLDCEKVLNGYRNKRCSSCENIRRFKGKTYENIMGKEKAQKIRVLRSIALKGKPKTIEHRKNLSNACKGRLSAFKGHHHTKESKKQLSLSRGGTGIPYENTEYGVGFDNNLKEHVRFRDKYKCQICGCSRLENERQLDVHHIDYDKRNNSIRNFISLCRSCHMKTNTNRNHWKKKLNINQVEV